MKSIVVAYDRNLGIGAKNDLLWRHDLPGDLRHFKDLTTDKAIIMGRKTFKSIGRALPHRQNIVITRKELELKDVEFVHSLNEAYAHVRPFTDAVIIGGAEIYSLALSTVDTIYATEVDAMFDTATVFFPKIDEKVWQETTREHHSKDELNKYDFDFVTYTRR